MMTLQGRDFLTVLDYTPKELRYILDTAKKLKAHKKKGKTHHFLEGKNIVILFEKDSTRTRCSFEVAGADLGMNVTYLGPTGSQMGKKESIADTARVLSRMYDGIEYRGYSQELVTELAKHSSVPVWNGLTDTFHPTQMMADFMTIEEHFGSLEGLTLAFVGDTRNNAGNSLMAMSAKMGVNFIACGPVNLWPDEQIRARCEEVAQETGSKITVTSDMNALKDADIIYADVWLSMGEPEEKWAERINLLKPYQVTTDVMNMARPNAVFMHALPSFHDLNTTIAREVYEKFGVSEMEVTNEVFESAKSIVFDEAENRMHTIKAVMFLTMTNGKGI